MNASREVLGDSMMWVIARDKLHLVIEKMRPSNVNFLFHYHKLSKYSKRISITLVPLSCLNCHMELGEEEVCVLYHWYKIYISLTCLKKVYRIERKMKWAPILFNGKDVDYDINRLIVVWFSSSWAYWIQYKDAAIPCKPF